MKHYDIIGARPYAEVRDDCHALKQVGSPSDAAAVRCARRIAGGMDEKPHFLIPVPSHGGEATDTLHLALAIAQAFNARFPAGTAPGVFAAVCNILTCDPHPPMLFAKHYGKEPEDIPIRVTRQDYMFIPKDLPLYLVDNVIDTGHTADACLEALRGYNVAGIIAVGDTGAWKEDPEIEAAATAVRRGQDSGTERDVNGEILYGSGCLVRRETAREAMPNAILDVDRAGVFHRIRSDYELRTILRYLKGRDGALQF